MKEFIVQKENENLRVDLYLSQVVDITRSQIKKLILNTDVQVNKKCVKSGYLLKVGDVVSINMPVEKSLAPQNISLDIIYEDLDIAVINKPQDLVVHPGSGNEDNTLVNALLYNFTSLASGSSKERPGIVHRLDKDTSGLMVIAKSDLAYEGLSNQFKYGKIKKNYLGIVHGLILESGTINLPIGRCKNDRKKMGVRNIGGREAYTTYEVIEELNGFTLLNISILTGRTHQIRVHMSHINHPIVGDLIYGYKNKHKIDKQLLHAYKLEFKHPVTGENMKFETNVPSRFTEFIRKVKR